MPGVKKFDKVVRPRVEDLHGSESEGEDGFDEVGEEGGSSPSVLDTGEGGDVLSSDEEGSEMDEDEDVEPEEQLKNVSFGTLAKAQDSLSLKRKRGSDATPQQDAKLDALRARLEEIRRSKGTEAKSSKKSKSERSKPDPNPDKTKSHKQNPKASQPDESDASSSDASSEDNASENDTTGSSRARSSKHAPTSQSSKYQVTRKRTVIDAPKRHSRDPRFTLPGAPANPNTEKAYSFLHSYEDDEMAELRTAIKKTKDEDARTTLRRKLMSMENRKKSRVDKERQQGVLREHRKREKEAVEQGKKPFYLKRAELKKQTLVRKYEGMKGKEREKAIERRRLREAQREKKSMPAMRRVAG